MALSEGRRGIDLLAVGQGASQTALTRSIFVGINQERATRRTLLVRAGEAFAESVGDVHCGYTTDEPAEIVVVYAGSAGIPLSIPL